MAIKRKPAKTDVDKVDEFISAAAAEKSSLPVTMDSAATHGKEKSEKVSKKLSKKAPTSHANIDEMLGSRKLLAANFKQEKFYVLKDLAKAIKKKASKGGKSEKNKIINLALQLYFAAEETKK